MRRKQRAAAMTMAARAFVENEELTGALERAGVDRASLQLHLLERDRAPSTGSRPRSV